MEEIIAKVNELVEELEIYGLTYEYTKDDSKVDYEFKLKNYIVSLSVYKDYSYDFIVVSELNGRVRYDSSKSSESIADLIECLRSDMLAFEDMVFPVSNNLKHLKKILFISLGVLAVLIIITLRIHVFPAPLPGGVVVITPVVTLPETTEVIQEPTPIYEVTPTIMPTQDGANQYYKVDGELFGISIGMEPSEVEEVLGKPIKMEEKYTEYYMASIIDYYYDYIEIYFVPTCRENKETYYVASIRIVKEGYEGPRGLQVGDNIDEVLDKLNLIVDLNGEGEKYFYEEEDRGGEVEYNSDGEINRIDLVYKDEDGEYYHFAVVIEDGIVTSFGMYVLSC